MKKIFALLPAAILMLAACGPAESDSSTVSPSQASEQTEPKPSEGPTLTEKTAVLDCTVMPEGLEPTGDSGQAAQEYLFTSIEFDDVKMASAVTAETVTSDEGKSYSVTHNRFWKSNDNVDLRLYANNKLTFSLGEGMSFISIKFTCSGKNKMTDSNEYALTGADGALAEENASYIMTAAEGATEIVFDFVKGKAVKLASIEVIYMG